MKKQSSIKNLQKKLSYSTEYVWDVISEVEKRKAMEFCEGYKDFLNAAKTERQAAAYIADELNKNGFSSIGQYEREGKNLKAGDKVYVHYRDKVVAAAVIGKRPLKEGLRIIASHIDSPRLDLKQNPIYEADGMVMADTHYYGGIKKYQWTTIPLSLHGVVIKNDGEKVNISIGENKADPVFYISDLLPHLAKDQMNKKATEVVTGEGLDVIIGSIPFTDDEEIKDRMKLSILNILNQEYGIVEEDFISAEIELVPAFRARDVGFDRGIVGGYGQDDRVCAYTSLIALLDINIPEYTALAFFADKEEIGSMGNTGMESRILENFVAGMKKSSSGGYNEFELKQCLANSKALSADVSGAYDPNYSDVSEKNNSAYLGKGIAMSKYGGARGKSGSSDANAEFVGEVRRMFNENNVVWQAGELGKVDQGGGGTVAMFMANYGMEVLDCGVPLISMHSPYELASKGDIYMAYKAYKVFMQ
ncbi:MAG: aminopeptidase [Clostridia bacterium]|nr:aminopeptidase [Clostridia bacterium]